MNVISMTSAEADQVRGPSLTDPSQVLTPAGLTNGGYILGVQNLTNPAFADRAALLSGFAQVDFATVSAFMPVTS